MQKVIVFRNGNHIRTRGKFFGDGPLTLLGKSKVAQSTREIVDVIGFQQKIKVIDTAILSSSIQSAMTLGEIWHVLNRNGMSLTDYEPHENYGSTREEYHAWEKLYQEHGANLEQNISQVGEKKAIMSCAEQLVMWSVERTMAAVKEALRAGKQIILVVTQSPHDTLIAEQLTGTVFDDCLGTGEYHIIDFTNQKLLGDRTPELFQGVK